MPPTDEPIAILETSSVFSALPASARLELAMLSREERYPSGTLLAGRDSRPDRLWYVCEGSVEVGLFSDGGRPALLTPIRAGGWATWLACFHEAPLPHDLWTGAATRLLAFPAVAVRRLAQANPQVYPRLIDQIGERTRLLIGWSLAASASNPARRLALLLSYSCQEAGRDDDGPFDLDLSQDRIAAMGMGTRQRVSRLLLALEQKGLIARSYAAIQVPSRSKLEKFALPF